MGEAQALGSALMWTVSSLIYVRLGAHVPASILNLLKTSMAFGLLGLTLLLLEGRVWPSLAEGQLFYLALSGIIGLTIGDTFWFIALPRIGVRRALLMTTLAPVFTALAAWPVLGEPITLVMAVGGLITLLGIAIVILDRGGEQAPEHLAFGLFCALMFSVCQAAGNILLRMGDAGLSALEAATVRLGTASVALAFCLLLLGRLREALPPLRTPRTAGAIFLACLIGTYLGIWLLTAGLQNTAVGIAATLSSTGPVWAVPLTRLVDSEHITPRGLIGALVAVAGVAVLILL